MKKIIRGTGFVLLIGLVGAALYSIVVVIKARKTTPRIFKEIKDEGTLELALEDFPGEYEPAGLMDLYYDKN